MTKEELIHKLAELEWEDFEVKEAKANVPKACWETVRAFSNTNGGWLIFGVKQNEKAVVKKPEFDLGSEKVRSKWEEVRNKLKNELKYLSHIQPDAYGLFTGYLWDKYGLNHKEISDDYGLRAIKILILIEVKPLITKKEMADTLGVSESTIEKELKEIADVDIIKRIGSQKTGYWQITAPNSNQ